MRAVYRGFTNLGSPPEGRLCRPDNINAYAVASGGGRGEGLPSHH